MVLSLVAKPLVIIPFRGSLDEINFDHTLKTTKIQEEYEDDDDDDGTKLHVFTCIFISMRQS